MYSTVFEINVNIQRVFKTNAKPNAVNQWRNDPPNYYLGKRDCVSFCMRVADAIGLDYDEWTTQSPAALINSLDRNN